MLTLELSPTGFKIVRKPAVICGNAFANNQLHHWVEEVLSKTYWWHCVMIENKLVDEQLRPSYDGSQVSRQIVHLGPEPNATRLLDSSVKSAATSETFKTFAKAFLENFICGFRMCRAFSRPCAPVGCWSTVGAWPWHKIFVRSWGSLWCQSPIFSSSPWLSLSLLRFDPTMHYVLANPFN